MPDLIPDECEWFELCDEIAVGKAAHPIHGVIGVCLTHVVAYSIPLITRSTPTTPESE